MFTVFRGESGLTVKLTHLTDMPVYVSDSQIDAFDQHACVCVWQSDWRVWHACVCVRQSNWHMCMCLTVILMHLTNMPVYVSDLLGGEEDTRWSSQHQGQSGDLKGGFWGTVTGSGWCARSCGGLRAAGRHWCNPDWRGRSPRQPSLTHKSSNKDDWQQSEEKIKTHQQVEKSTLVLYMGQQKMVLEQILSAWKQTNS